MASTETTHETLFEDASSPYRQVFEALVDPVLIVDRDRATILGGNQAATETLDFDRSQLRGLALETICGDLRTSSGERVDPATVLATDAACDRDTESEDTPERGEGTTGTPEGTVGNDSEPATVRGQITDGTGETFWAEMGLSTVTIDGTAYSLWTIKDRGETVRREQDRRSFKTAVEHAGHAIYWTDRKGRIEYANPAFEAITGYDRETVVGEHPRILQSGEMDEAYYRDLWDTILAGETFESEVVNEDADGNRIVLDQTVAPIPGPSGKIHRFVAVNNDITDRKQREELLEAEKDRIERLHQRLSVMNRILRHDIRSSVNIIQGNAELASSAERRLDGALETIEEEADRLQRIGESVRHIQEVLEGEASAGNVVDLSTLATTKVLTSRNDFPEAEFSLDVPEAAPVRAREGIDLALDHVLTNAVEHSDRESPTVEVSIETDREGVVVLRIADDGPGIPAAELQPIREGRETPLEHTSGLGLWLTHWIVEASQGTLSFEDRDPRGTVVVIELDAA